MWKFLSTIFLGFFLTHCIIYIAASYGGSFTPGAGGIIGFSVGFARIYTEDNKMFSWDTWFLLISCILGGMVAGYRV